MFQFEWEKISKYGFIRVREYEPGRFEGLEMEDRGAVLELMKKGRIGEDEIDNLVRKAGELDLGVEYYYS